MPSITYEQLARVARLYASSKEAATALGITRQTFVRQCRKHGLDTPYHRRQKERAAQTKPEEE